MAQYAFYFDQSACVGCKACQVACKENHHLPAGALLRKVLNYQGGSWSVDTSGIYVPDGVFGYFTSTGCAHCDAPACLEACAAGAIEKDAATGIVTIDAGLCTGCKACLGACPYGAPTFDVEAGVARKCDFCAGEMAVGRKPVCVAACPMRALDYGTVDELVERYGAGDVEVEPLPRATTGPNLVLKPHPAARPSGTGGGRVVNLAEEL